MAQHQGFTCPQCGSHYFGTHMHHPVMGDRYPPKASIGSCHGYYHAQSECRYQWNRDDPVAEALCMSTPTPEEWMATFQPRGLSTVPRQ